MTRVPRDEKGRVVSRSCPDENCGGVLMYEPEIRGPIIHHDWRCDGLTHKRADDELQPCPRYVFGPTSAIRALQPEAKQ